MEHLIACNCRLQCHSHVLTLGAFSYFIPSMWFRLTVHANRASTSSALLGEVRRILAQQELRAYRTTTDASRLILDVALMLESASSNPYQKGHYGLCMFVPLSGPEVALSYKDS